MEGIIYKTINLINDKIYIGQTIRKGKALNKYLGGGIYLNKAIKKYGRENFKKEILKENIHCQTALDLYEKIYIKKYRSRDLKIGYNLADGGKNIIPKGSKRSIEACKLISQKRLGVKHTPEHCKNIGIARKGKGIGNTHGKANKGKKLPPRSKEWREKISKANKGRIHSIESNLKNSQSNKGRKAWNKGLTKQEQIIYKFFNI